MKRIACIVVFYLAMTGLLSISHAARDPHTSILPSTGLQLVVLEVEDCIYCDVFRRQLLPAYQSSRQGRKAPVRFVDINDPALGEIGLTAPIGTVPTFVVLEDNREIGRIPGLMGHHDFFRAIDYILAGR